MPFDMTIDYDSGMPVYRQIEDAVRAAIAGGNLKPDERLPTIHELAGKLDVNPNTVAKAYRDLEVAGVLTAVRGKGTFAAERAAPAPMTGREREALLRQIYEKALAEGARHAIDVKDVVSFFRKEKR